MRRLPLHRRGGVQPSKLRVSVLFLSWLGFMALVFCLAWLVSVVLLNKTLSAVDAAWLKVDDAVDERVGTSVEPDCWAFQHLHKSGGMTIRRIMNPPKGDLDANGEIVGYGTDEWRLGGRFRDGTLLPQLLDEKRYRIATGGYVGALRLSPRLAKNCQYFTVFRHPVSRVVSAYHYCRSSKHNWDPLCASNVLDSTEVSLVDFAEHWGNYAVRQMVMSYIPAETVLRYIDEVGGGGGENRPATLDGVLVDDIPSWFLLKYYLQHGYHRQKSAGGRKEAASSAGAAAAAAADPETFNDDEALSGWLGSIQNLISYNYTAIGVVEEFDTTMALFDGVGVIPGKTWSATYGKLGAANKNEASETERGAAMRHAFASEEIKKYIRLDVLLYEHAVAVFDDMVRRHVTV